MFSTRLGILRSSPTSILIRNTVKSNLRAQARNFATQQKNVPKKSGIKALMSKYGSTALVVYLGITLIDLPLCFLLVHSLGKDTIQEYKDKVKKMIGWNAKDEIDIAIDEEKENEKVKLSKTSSSWEKFKKSPLLTEFLIAYGIHKSLIIVRIPLTAAITPYTVRLLKGWGFNIGKGNKMLSTIGENAKMRFKTKNPNDFIKPDPTNASQIRKITDTKGHKWFNGLM
ncbi:hypothetical protein NCAS_0C05580 [Naumovozyma castellii]|uniref:DUF1279 domain-containing protein n=1 Tax=Naumovozyma castellii TaxID=27288 RepID=G0VDI6_NAUCA|nr:hypothetical protein NCAS_0C05580 [Naumovozyma castellii CBS 4309]CCC69548.1 hypothetical protein NCAS_0C05580 [Naumovozyma castellii CBS 4309]